MIPQALSLPGVFTIATLPPAAAYERNIAWVTDRPDGAGGVDPGPMISNGSVWRIFNLDRRVYFTGTTNASGVFSGTVTPAFTTIKHVNLQAIPSTDNTVFVRLTAYSVNGFTAVAEQRSGLTVLGITLLSLATTPFVGQALTVEMIGT